jgi:hypothetical protein
MSANSLNKGQWIEGKSQFVVSLKIAEAMYFCLDAEMSPKLGIPYHLLTILQA